MSTETTTVTTHVARRAALAFLEDAGWTVCTEHTAAGRMYVSFTQPRGTPRSEGGRCGSDFYWQLDEAFTAAVENLYGTAR